MFADTTLAELKAGGEGVTAHCARPALLCGHHTVLDLNALIDRLGPDFMPFDGTLGRWLRCEACGHKGATVHRLANTRVRR